MRTKLSISEMKKTVREKVQSKKLTRRGCLTLVLLALVVALPAYALAPTPKAEAPLVSSTELGAKGEVIGKRTINSKTTLLEVLPDGRKRYAVDTSMNPVHYKDNLSDPNEAWKDIDTTIRPSEDAHYQFHNRKNLFKSYFKRHARANDAVRYQIGEDFITYTLKDNELGPLQDVAGYPERNMFVYPQAYPGVDVKYSVQSVRLLEEFVLYSYRPVEQISQEISFEGAYFEEQEDGSYVFYDVETNEELWIIPQPLMYELDDPAERSYGIHYKLYSNGDDTFTLVKVLDEEGKAWLANEARNFPVAIDATLDKGIVQSLDDCDHSQGYAATMFFGGVGSPKPADCGQGFRFQNIPLSQGDTVTSAYLSIVINEDYWITIDVRLTAIDLDNCHLFQWDDLPGQRPITLSYIAVESPDVQRYAGERVNYPTTAGLQQTLGAAINHVINRPGWQTGNAIAVVNNSYQDPNASTTYNRWYYRTYDYGSSEVHGPKLHLEYTTASGDEYTYYFDGYDSGEHWDNAPNMTNGETGTHAWTYADGSTQHLNSNTCSAGASEILRPVGVGTTTQMEQYPESGQNWDKVDEDEVPPDGDTVVGANWSGAYDLYEVADHVTGAGDINSVTIHVWAASYDSDPYTLRTMLRTGGTNHEGAGHSVTTWDPNYVEYTEVYTTNPTTGQPWTWDQVDAMEIGAKSTGVTGYSSITQVYAVVGYTPGTAELGTITKVELRVHGGVHAGSGTDDDIILRPVFGGTSDGNNHQVDMIDYDSYGKDWSEWVDITTDTNAPGTWTWNDLVALDCDVVHKQVNGLDYMLAGKVEIRVTCGELVNYTITVTQASGGSITPSGSVVVDQGSNPEFTITPDTGYVISDVEVDGSSVGAESTYTFFDVSADHDITASFNAVPTYEIIVTQASGGVISPGGTVTVTQGDNETFYITADTGYTVADVIVDGGSVGAKTSHTFTNVTEPHTLTAVFEVVPTYTITASAGNYGTIAPEGDVVVSEGDDQEFTITPDSGYAVQDVLVDGLSVGAVSTYTFPNVTADHTIDALFIEGGIYTIIAVAGNGGSISPEGTITLAAGNSQTFTITPDAGRSVLDVEVDGVSQGAITSKTFSSISSGHVIVAYFDVPCDECLDLSSVPLGTLIHAAPPNIMILLDDSGSMDWEFLVQGEDQGCFQGHYQYVFDNAGDNSEWEILSGDHRGKWKSQWSARNRMYYNPSIDYEPWPGLDPADRDTPRSNPAVDGYYFDLNATYWVPGERIIDDYDYGFSLPAGTWTEDWNDEAYSDHFWETTAVGVQHTARWDPNPNLTPGYYYVYAWWRDFDTYSTSVRYKITYNKGMGGSDTETKSLYVNQRQNSKQWNQLDSNYYWFGGYDTNKIELIHTPSDGNNHACADAVKFVPTDALEIKNAHYYTYEDTNANEQHDTGEPVYLVVIDGEGGSYNITYYLATISGSGDDEEVTDLTEVSLGSVPDSVKSTRTASEERQNFANWYSYHRRRAFAATSAVANLILNMQGVQIGLYSIHNRVNQSVLKVKVEGVDETDQLLDILYNTYTTNIGGMTPLRRGLEAVGRYYHQNDSETGGIGSSPFATAENGGECQQAFAILMTDGYWNGDAPLNVTEIQNVDGDNGVPYADTYTQTLADVAMYYYENDLSTGASGLANKVPTNPVDDATHQHMVTYGVAFGAPGNLNPDDYDEDLKHKQTGVLITWPNVHAEWGGPSKVDDLWHASVNGRGSFLSASDPAELVSALRDIMQSIEARIASSASISVNGDQLYGTVGANILMFQSTYNPDGWSGDVKAYQVDTATGAVITDSYIWSAADELDNMTTSRHIATYDPASDNGRPFAWGQLDDTQKGQLNNDETILDFLRGDRSNEAQYGGGLRNRFTILGDIVHSSAIFNDGYLFVGANDGMLHCLNATTGVEQFAYVPNLLFDKLADLADPAYGTSHQYYVDLSPSIQPGVDEGGTTITLLVGGLGGGGKGYYALDVTDPSTMTSDSLVANKVKWEFGNDIDLGFTYPKPTIVETNDDDVNKNSTAWIVITGNGYNSQNGNAVLFILDPVDGSVIKRIDVGNGPCNGLSTPAAVDADSDGDVDYVYAGDLKGNLWKFDLTNADYMDWDVAYKDGATPKPLFRCPGQPITAQPDVMVHCEKHGFMVLFGTGKYIEGDDPADTGLQTIYGVWDYGDDDDESEYLGIFIRGGAPQLSNHPGTVTLVRQTIVPSTEADPNFWTLGDTKLRILTSNTPDWTTSSLLADGVTCGEGLGEADCDPNGTGTEPDPRRSAGWYFDLPISGEKVISDALIRAEKVIIISFVSEDDPCGSGGDSIVHELDSCSGGRLASAQFDIDNSGNIGTGDLINIGTAEDPIWVAPAGVNREGRLQPPAILRLTTPEDEEMKYYSSSTGEIRQEQGPSVGLGISHWREYR